MKKSDAVQRERVARAAKVRTDGERESTKNRTHPWRAWGGKEPHSVHNHPALPGRRFRMTPR